MTGRKPIAYAGTELTRRHFLAGLSLATLAGVGLTRCSVGTQPRVAQAAAGAAEPLPVVAVRIPLPGGGATLPKGQMAEQLRHNHQFLWSDYGVDARPYFRPPYGSHNPVVDRIAAELGYSVPTMWSGTLEDQNISGEDEIVKMADKYFRP
jgi:hypothetical protein